LITEKLFASAASAESRACTTKLYLLYISEVLILQQAMPLPEAVWLAQQILKLPDGDPSL